jgi:hypothetical protein
MREIKRFVSPGGTRMVRLCERDGGRFFFEEEYEDVEDLRHLGYGVERCWVPGFVSGTYDDIDAAEKELRAVTPWLKDAKQFDSDGS